jgi:UDP-N-acetylmuramoylalanine--D-glutamate ligase
VRNTENYKNKKVIIVGLGRSGLACANLLYDLGADVSVTDNSDTELTHANALRLKSKQIKVELGRHTQEFIRDKDLMIISPGVRSDALAVTWAENFKIPIISEIEIASDLCPATVIAVTGSNGKTTVTTLIGNMLKAKGKKVFICGNIGNPFSGEVEKIKDGDFVSLEVSSFQLEWVYKFKPKISVILNFATNHLDRYKNIQQYLEAKKRIFMNQDRTDYLVLNNEDPVVRELAKETAAHILYFSQTKDINPNQAALLTVGTILGINKEIICKVLKEFKGIEHRMEYVAEINNVKFVNDSKATTVDSTIWALKNISRPVVLIAGGRDKGLDYSIILGLGRKKIREIILIGEAREKIKSVFKGLLPIEEAVSLEEAVRIAYFKARPGDCVLLSPMCSSFDMFSNYEERGRCFKRVVYDLVRNDR